MQFLEKIVNKHRNIKLVTTEKRRNYLASEPNYHTTKFFTENVLAREMRRTQILMNKPVYLGSSKIDLSKTEMYTIWYDFVKLKYGENSNFVIWLQTASLFM